MQFPFTRAPLRLPQENTLVRWPVVMRTLVVAAFASSLSAWAAAQAPINVPLSLTEALHLAQTRSYALVAQDAAARSAREMAVAAGQLPDPLLRLGVNSLPVDGSNAWSLTRDFMTIRLIGVMQTFTREDKRKARATRFEREAEVAESSRSMQVATLRRDTAIAWLDRYYQQQTVELLTQQRDEAALQIEAAEAAYRAGRGMQADVFMARSAVARIEDRIRATQANLANATTMLARWVGERASDPVGRLPPIADTRLAAHPLAHQLNQHPDIALMAKREAVALADADIARQEKRADWSVELAYGQRGPDFSNMVSLAVSVPLQWNQKNRQDRELAAKLATAEQIRAEREEITRQHLAETSRWLQTWRSNLGRLADYDQTLIPLATERTHAALAAYRGAKGALSAVLEARRMEIDTRIERLRIETETAVLWAALEYLIPTEFEGEDILRTSLTDTVNGKENQQ